MSFRMVWSVPGYLWKYIWRPAWGGIDSVFVTAFWIRILAPLPLKLCLSNGFQKLFGTDQNSQNGGDQNPGLVLLFCFGYPISLFSYPFSPNWFKHLQILTEGRYEDVSSRWYVWPIIQQNTYHVHLSLQYCRMLYKLNSKPSLPCSYQRWITKHLWLSTLLNYVLFGEKISCRGWQPEGWCRSPEE